MINVIKILLKKETRQFFSQMHNIFKEDKNYSLKNLYRATRRFSKDNKITVFNEKLVMCFVIPPIPSKPFLTYIYATKEKDNVYTQNALLQKTAPLTVSLGITDKCGYDCLYCSAKGRAAGTELNTSQWINIVKTLQDMGTPVITFTGGEPLLRKDISEIIRAVDERSMTLLFTSAQGLTIDKAKELKQAGLYGVTISIDSYDEKTQNRRRGSDKAFSNSISGIKNSIAAGLYTSASCVVSKESLNKDEMFKIFDFFNVLNVNELILIPPFNSGRWMGKDDELYNQEDIIIFTKILRQGNKKFKKLKMTSELNNCNPNYFGCAAGIQHSHINPYGELFPCEIAPLSFGNVVGNDLKLMWNNMRDAIERPHLNCLANEAFSMISDEILPVSCEKSVEICKKFTPDKYPAIYSKLLGN